MTKTLNKKTQSWHGAIGDCRGLKRVFQAVVLGCLAYERTAKAQEVFMSRPEISLTPVAMQQFETNGMVFLSGGSAAEREAQKSPFRWGLVTLRPHLFYRFTEGTGIPTAGTNHVATAIHEFAPGLLFEIGRHWTLDYTPTWRFFSNNKFKDTLDHSITLTGGIAYEDWVLGLVQRVEMSSAPLVETGTQTDQEIYSTGLNASYRFNSKMSADLGLNQRFVSSSGFNSFREWSNLNWLNYQFGRGLDAGIGVGFGYVDVDTGSDMAYEQLQGRINWRVTDKIGFEVHGGVENRQFLMGGVSDLISPVAGARVQYQPFETTRLSLNADHTVTPSTIVAGGQNQITESTAIGIRLNQRLLKRFYLDLGGEYHDVAYSAAGGGATGRKDEFYSFSVRLSCAFLKRANVAVFYQISDNLSSQSGYTYSTTQIGIEVGYRF